MGTTYIEIDERLSRGNLRNEGVRKINVEIFYKIFVGTPPGIVQDLAYGRTGFCD